MKIRAIILLSVVLAVYSFPVMAAEEDVIHARAVRSAKAGQVDFVYMEYGIILRDYPGSKYTPQALFAHGEYFFCMHDLSHAAEMFQTYLDQYPQSEGELFALAYLMAIAGQRNDAERVQELKNEILARQRLGLVFSDSKDFHYLSPMSRKLKVAFYIDRIEFYEDKNLIDKVSY